MIKKKRKRESKVDYISFIVSFDLENPFFEFIALGNRKREKEAAEELRLAVELRHRRNQLAQGL